jgi:hypothetical protein
MSRAATLTLEGRADCPDHLGQVPGPRAVEAIALDSLAQLLIRVELGAVGREEEEANPDCPLGKPGLERLSAVHRGAVHEEKAGSAAVTEQAGEGPEKHGHAEPPP